MPRTSTFPAPRRGTRRLTPPVLLVLLLSACGSGSGSGSSGGEAARVTDYFLDRALAVETCAGMGGSEELRVEFGPTTACPTSGRRCCLASEPPAPCPGAPDRLCGAAGRFLVARRTILLPDECDAALEHELVHGLLFLAGDPDWRDHAHPAFRCAALQAGLDD